MKSYQKIIFLFGLIPGTMWFSLTTGQNKKILRKSVQDSVFTETQANQGSKLYRKACVRCHHPRQFVGPAYMDSWTGARVHDFLEVIRRTMPTENPGSLKREEYVEIVAFLFRLNSIPSGSREMSSDQTALKLIKIEGPYKRARQNKKSKNKG